MGLVSGSGPGGVTKGVISFWFRVPATSINECAAAYRVWQAEDDALHDAGLYGKRPPPFAGVIPLMTFGQGVTNKSVGVDTSRTFEITGENHFWVGGAPGGAVTCQWHSEGVHTSTGPLWTWIFDGKFDFPTEPSYIGIDCRAPAKDADSGAQQPFVPRLAFNIQTQQVAEVSGGSMEDTVSIDVPFQNNWSIGHEPYYGDDGESGADAGCAWPPYHVDDNGNVVADMGENPPATITVKGRGPFAANLPQEELFRSLPPSYPQPGAVKGSVPITPDHWHHFLMSFDFSLPVQTTGRMEPGTKPKPGTLGSACKMWIALDGKNLKKKQLSYTWPSGGQDNDLITVMARLCFDDNVYPKTGLDVGKSIVVDEAAAQFSLTVAPLDLTPIGLPSLDQYTDAIRKVEMAELQIYTDASLSKDAAKTDLDYAEYEGREKTRANETCKGTFPLDLSDKDNREAFIHKGKPVPPDQKAVAGNDYHSGAIDYMGLMPDVMFHGTKKWQKGDNPGPLGPFNPSGDIKAYKPDPSLGGPQGESSGAIDQGMGPDQPPEGPTPEPPDPGDGGDGGGEPLTIS